MRAIAFGLQDGSGFWRIRIPFGELNKHGHECILSPNAINEEEMKGKDVIVLKNVTDKEGIASALAMREIQGSKIIMDIDDAIKVREDNPMLKDHIVEDANFVFTRTAKFVDAITVTTEYLAENIRKITDKPVIVAPNSYDPSYHLVKNTKHLGQPRIIWAGSITHSADLQMIAPVVKRIKERFGVKFVTIGDTRVKEWWGSDTEVRPSVGIAYYMQTLASLSGDIGICPLVDDEFNRNKSQIKAIEYGLLGLPVVASPTVYNGIPTIDIASSEEEWFEYLSKLIEDKEYREDRGKKHYNWVKENCSIEKSYKVWEDLYVNSSN